MNTYFRVGFATVSLVAAIMAAAMLYWTKNAYWAFAYFPFGIGLFVVHFWGYRTGEPRRTEDALSRLFEWVFGLVGVCLWLFFVFVS